MRTTRPGQSSLLLLDALPTLRQAGVDYAVIGAMAASFHGVVRASIDADAVLSLRSCSLRTLESALKNAGFKTTVRLGDVDDPIPGMLILTDGFGNQVDLLTGIRGMDPELFSRTVEVPFEGEAIHIIGLEDFIATKLYAGSPKDLEDARLAIAVSGHMLDHSLLQRVVNRFGSDLNELLSKLIKTDSNASEAQ